MENEDMGGGGSRKLSNVIRGDYFSEVTFRPPSPPKGAKEEIVHVDRKTPPPPLPLVQSHAHKVGLGPFKSKKDPRFPGTGDPKDH